MKIHVHIIACALALSSSAFAKSVKVEVLDSDNKPKHILTVTLPEDGTTVTEKKGSMVEYTVPAPNHQRPPHIPEEKTKKIPDGAKQPEPPAPRKIQLFKGLEFQAKLLSNGYVEYQIKNYTPTKDSPPTFRTDNSCGVIKEDHRKLIPSFGDMGRILITLQD